MSAAAGALALVVASCTLLGGRELVQCRTNEECPSLQCDFATNLCKKAVVDASVPESALPDVVPDNGNGGACKVHGDCVPGDACVAKQCVKVGLATAPCSNLPVGEFARDVYRDPKAVVVGIYIFGSGGGPEAVAADAALNLINSKLQVRNDGIRIGAIYCSKSDKLSKSSAKTTAERLETMGVNALLGQLELSELLSTPFRDQVKKAGLTVLSTLGNAQQAQDPTAANDVTYRFLVDELQSQIDDANAMNPFEAAISEADTRVGKLYADAGKAKPNPVKVSFLVAADPTNEQTIEAGALYAKVKATAILTGGGFQLEAPTLVPSAYETAVEFPANIPADDLKSASPQIIIGIGGDEISAVMKKVEGPGGWNLANPRPVWINSARAKFNDVSIRQLSTLSNSFAKRFIGVDFDGDKDKSDKLKGDSPVDGVQAFDTLYDGLFAFALGAARADLKRAGAMGPLTGAQLLKGFDEVIQKAGAPSTETFEIPASFEAAIGAVRADKLVHMRGITGPWQMSVAPPKRGVRRMTAATNPYYCFLPDALETSHYLDANALRNTCAVP